MRFSIQTVALLMAAFILPAVVSGDVVTVDAVGDSRGAINSATLSALGQPVRVASDSFQVRWVATGTSLPSPFVDNTNFEATRNYQIFDLSGVSGTITGAQLKISHPSNSYDDANNGATETVTFYDVSSASSDLKSPTTANQTALFDDLGSGSIFGSFTASASANGTIETITLNAAAIASLNGSIGGDWAIGGALTSADATDVFGFERLLKGTGSSTAASQLVITTSAVPEPGSLAILGLFAGTATLTRRRK